MSTVTLDQPMTGPVIQGSISPTSLRSPQPGSHFSITAPEIGQGSGYLLP